MAASEPLAHPLAGSGVAGRRARVGEYAFQALCLLALLAGLAVLIALMVEIVQGAASVISERLGSFISSGLSTFPERAGVWQGIVGSVQIAVITVATAFPVGIATAIYIEEYASDNRLTRLLDINIRNLAGVPSIVYGLLGFAIFTRFLGPRDLGGVVNLTGGGSALSGGLTLAILVLPIVIITSAEAIRAVPRSLREAGYGLGATRWDVTKTLVLPNAAPGILTGTILALSRAIGETAPLLVVVGGLGFLSTGGAGFVESFREPFTALPVVVFNWSRLPQAEYREALAPAAILVLLVFTLTLNAIAIYLRNRYDPDR